EDHFTVDEKFMNYLRVKNKIEHLNALASFYEKVRNSTIVFANQPQPLGFADAVYRAKFFSGDEDFVVHAGDDLIVPIKNYMQRLVSVFSEYKANAAFFVQRVKDPTKYGVVTGEKIANGIYHVKRVIEKPSKPPSNLAIVAIYAFKPKIYHAIEQVKPGINDEIQLTDAIQVLINQGDAVYAVELGPGEKRIEIGDPASYREAFITKTV
ncbi:MAG: sugar phosphate nucleotidyltransferase, partial [Promethearchaeota archaeon]